MMSMPSLLMKLLWPGMQAMGSRREKVPHCLGAWPRSSTSTLAPSRARVRATEAPPGPLPTTMASTFIPTSSCGSSLFSTFLRSLFFSST